MKLAVLTSGLFSYTGGPPVVIANLLNQLNKFDEILTFRFNKNSYLSNLI